MREDAVDLLQGADIPSANHPPLLGNRFILHGSEFGVECASNDGYNRPTPGG